MTFEAAVVGSQRVASCDLSREVKGDMKLANDKNLSKIREVPLGENRISALPGASRFDWSLVLKPTCEAWGFSYEADRRYLMKQSWATTSKTEVVASDGHRRPMVTIDRPTTLLWLATKDASKIKDPEKRATLTLFQKGAAQVLDAAFDDDLRFDPEKLAQAIQTIAMQSNLIETQAKELTSIKEVCFSIQADQTKLAAVLASVVKNHKGHLPFVPTGLHRPTEWWDEVGFPWREIAKINRDDLWTLLKQVNDRLSLERRPCKPDKRVGCIYYTHSALSAHRREVVEKYTRLQRQMLLGFDAA